MHTSIINLNVKFDLKMPKVFLYLKDQREVCILDPRLVQAASAKVGQHSGHQTTGGKHCQ